MQKQKALRYLMWDEKAIRQNKNRNKGAQVTQLEKLHVLTAEDLCLCYKKRQHFNGTSHGDCIGPIVAPDWEATHFNKSFKPFNGTQDEKETWRMSYNDKKTLYGPANRVAVGGRGDGGEKGALPAHIGKPVFIFFFRKKDHIYTKVLGGRTRISSRWLSMRCRSRLSFG